MSHSHTAHSLRERQARGRRRFWRLLRWVIAIPAVAGMVVALPLILADARSGAWQGFGIGVLVLAGTGITAALRPPRIWLAAVYIGIWTVVSSAAMAILLDAIRL
jgi:hypothetical protein